MIEAVFISDLHLSPRRPDIEARFDDFLQWAEKTVPKAIYILGDFFHAWPGDDLMDDWCKEVAKKMQKIKNSGIMLYYMHGNRDFLLGEDYARLAGWTVIEEPYLLRLQDENILLVHGDRYCTKDKGHQRFMKLTRNSWFRGFFLKLPKALRLKLVSSVRKHSQKSRKSPELMDVVIKDVLAHMKQLSVKTLIHGHTHLAGLSEYYDVYSAKKRYVLSDWDDKPSILCYDKANRLYYDHY